MWERSIGEDNARYKRSAEMFSEVQCHSRWNQRELFSKAINYFRTDNIYANDF